MVRTSKGSLYMPKKRTRAAATHAKQATPTKRGKQIVVNISGKTPSATEDSFINAPKATVLARECEYADIQGRVQAFLAHGVSSVVYITGVPGSGKTHTVSAVLRSLETMYAHINCSKLKRKQDIFRAISASLSCCSRCELDDLKAHLTECENKHILFIDEADFLRTRNEVVLYNLLELAHMADACVLLILISNTLGSLSTRVESRIGKDRLDFAPYKAGDLRKIVEARSAQIDVDKATGRQQRSRGAGPEKAKRVPADGKLLELISKRVASTTGDVRKAFEMAERVGNTDFIAADAIIKDMAAPLLIKFVRVLGYYQKLLIFLNLSSSKSTLQWFNDFKAFCKLKDIPEIGFIAFSDCVAELASQGIFKVSGLNATSIFHREEFEEAMKNDPVFQSFS